MKDKKRSLDAKNNLKKNEEKGRLKGCLERLRRGIENSPMREKLQISVAGEF